MKRFARLALAAFPLVLLGPMARAAEPDLAACVGTYEQGQQARRHGELRRAREELLVCARAPCPKEMWPDCQQWLEEIEQQMPSVVLAARDRGGHDVIDAKVYVDGAPFADRLDSRAVDIDPGEHTFRFVWGGRPPIEERVTVREGEKARVLTVEFESRPSAPPPSPSSTASPRRVRHVAPGAWVAGGVGVAALGAFAYFGLTGRSEYFNLEHVCAPYCSSSTVAPTRTKFLVADVSLGVAVVSLGVAAYLFLASPATSDLPGRVAGRVHLDLRADARGAAGSLRWTY
jgi:hypothetical protein